VNSQPDLNDWKKSRLSLVNDLDDIILPPHVYVPGRSPRHPDDWFDEIKNTVTQDVSPENFGETRAFMAGLKYLEYGYYWECHEVLEAVWMRTIDPSPERDMASAIIQLANARLKVLMGLPRAARRLCDMVDTHLSRCPEASPTLGLMVVDLKRKVEQTREALKDAI